MEIDLLKNLFKRYKEPHLYHRYITNTHIEPLLNKLLDDMTVETIGESVLKKPIYGIKIGHGSKRILMWSQMHGNESTTTKAIFDLLNTLLNEHVTTDPILKTCCIYIIPILNPDGAEAYTRVNANLIDLNRDAQLMSQPESKLLRQVFNDFKPHFCYNLHGQRTIFSAGNSNYPATVSFLSPAQDENCTITPNRKVSMEIISVMNGALQKLIPKQIGVYDDAFNINCVGDTFQSFNIPTILFEAGHYPNDYEREQTRMYIYISLLISIQYIAKNEVSGSLYLPYLNIPENDKRFFDIIIRNVKMESKDTLTDIGILYQEILKDNQIDFIPKIDKIDDLKGFYGHKEIDAHGNNVFNEAHQELEVGYENVFVSINNEIFSLLLK
jgi:hypothetical protein